MNLAGSGFVIATGGLVPAGGGTGLTSYTTGNILYASSSTALAKLAPGTSTQLLHSGTTPSWSAVSLTADVTGTLPVANGGTGQTAFTANGLIYTPTTTTTGSLVGSTTNQPLVWNGTQWAASAIAWGQDYGDCSDGDATIAANTSLTTFKNYRNLVINSGVTLDTDGFQLFVCGTISGAGNVRASGNAASGATAGADSSTGNFYLGYGFAGGNGAAGGGSAGSNSTPNSLGARGGNGGAGSGGAGGSSGTVATPAVYWSSYRTRATCLHNLQLQGTGISYYSGGSGGGGGGGNGAQSGGGGGGGGGVFTLAAKHITLTGMIGAPGGAGANGTASNTGGGGGGGGGEACVVADTIAGSPQYSDMVNGVITASGGPTISVAGGAKGLSGGGTGVDGSDGTAGTLVMIYGINTL